ncbi:hypothetical protein MMC11_003572 [Xylographa trunciseda]|nr:hypothetical protein [Xylographa trunciseda]
MKEEPEAAESTTEDMGAANITIDGKNLALSLIEEVKGNLSITEEVELVVSTIEEVDPVDSTTGDKDLAASTIEHKHPGLKMIGDKCQHLKWLTAELRTLNFVVKTNLAVRHQIERGGEVPQMTPAQIAEKARQDQIDAAERKRITETVNIGKPGCAGTEPTRAGGSLEGQRQRNDGLYIGEVTDIAGMQSAQEWEKNTILIWLEINPINENMHEFQLNRYRPFTIETIVKMYDDILDFENKDFIEGQWRSFIEFVQYTAPFYITYHFFPKIFHKIGAMAKSFVDAEAGNVKGLVDGIVEKTISGPPPCPFIPQVQEAVRMAIEAKGGVFQDRHTPRTQSAPPDESNTRASPKMLSLLDEPVPEIKFYSVLSLESGGRGSLNAVNAPTKVNKGVLTGDVVPFVPAKMKQSIADVGLIGSRWAVSEEADVTEMGLGQSRFARPATKGPGNKMSRGIYTGDTGNVGSTATQDVEFKRQTKW